MNRYNPEGYSVESVLGLPHLRLPEGRRVRPLKDWYTHEHYPGLVIVRIAGGGVVKIPVAEAKALRKTFGAKITHAPHSLILANPRHPPSKFIDVPCGTCGGSGVYWISKPTKGFLGRRVACPKCYGTGVQPKLRENPYAVDIMARRPGSASSVGYVERVDTRAEAEQILAREVARKTGQGKAILRADVYEVDSRGNRKNPVNARGGWQNTQPGTWLAHYANGPSFVIEHDASRRPYYTLLQGRWSKKTNGMAGLINLGGYLTLSEAKQAAESARFRWNRAREDRRDAGGWK